MSGRALPHPYAAAVTTGERATLFAQIAAGSTTSGIEALYDHYAPRIYGLGRRLLNDDGLAEELVQETIVRVWRQAARFDPERGSADTFVFTIARRLAIDLYRRPSSRPFDELPIEKGALDDRIGAVVNGIAVRDALDSLSPAHRQVLDLVYRGDLKQSEVAERLGVPLGTVKTRCFHALRALKAALAEGGDDV
jgi:RNA polymerase sigma-70 factor (ECF subfamily)